MRTLIMLCALLGSASAVLADDFPVKIDPDTSKEPCVDALPGRGYELICTQVYKNEVRPLSARLCKLPDGTWILNLRWKCEHKD